MAKLTQKTLLAIRADQSGTVVRDDGKLFGRVRAKADGVISVSFYYRYRVADKWKDVACGTWPADPLTDIRTQRNTARRQIGDGIDPAVHKKLAKQETQDAIAVKLAAMTQRRNEDLTVHDLFDFWLADGVRRNDGNAELRRSFNADVLPRIGKKRIKEVSEHDLRGVLRALVGRGVNRTAVATRNNLMQMFAWAEKRQPWRKLLIEGNPMELIEIEKIVSPDYDLDSERDRILSAPEIRELRDIFEQGRVSYSEASNRRSAPQPMVITTECAIWIMLSTLCRVGELSMARWEHVDLEAGTWLIPKQNVKGKLEKLDVFLSSFALAQFRRLHDATGQFEWCFPAKNKDGHVCVKSISKQVGDRQAMFKKGMDGKPRKPMKNRRHDNTFVLLDGKNGAWTPHDLRRTGATLMQSLGVALEIIDRCQNHVLPGSKVRRHYMHHDYADEKRAAWCLLSDRLDLILYPVDNVIVLHSA